MVRQNSRSRIHWLLQWFAVFCILLVIILTGVVVVSSDGDPVTRIYFFLGAIVSFLTIIEKLRAGSSNG